MVFFNFNENLEFNAIFEYYKCKTFILDEKDLTFPADADVFLMTFLR